MSKKLAVGDKVPSFSVSDENGNVVSDQTLLGRKYVLMFYPAVESPGCTLQACQIRDEYSDIRDLGFEIYGISRDSKAKQIKFQQGHSLKYPMLSDESGALHETFGITRTAHLFAFISGGKSRTTIVIDEHGKVVTAWYGVNSVGHATRLLSVLRKNA